MFQDTRKTCIYLHVLAYMAGRAGAVFESMPCDTKGGAADPSGPVPDGHFGWLGVLQHAFSGRAGAVFESMPCDTKSGAADPSGPVPDGHFGWLGVLQHAFHVAKSTQYAITTGLLIHPGFVLASAEDIGKIPADEFANSTKFILWDQDGHKHVVSVYDFILHPEYTGRLTSGTVALVRLHRWAAGHRVSVPITPVCLPLRGLSDIDNLNVIKFTDVNMKMEKEMFKVNYVPNRECEEFYYRAGLSLKDKAPMHTLCAVQAGRRDPCLWEAGALLVTRINLAHWTVLGFGVRGPGCGAPSRYIMLHRYLTWLDETIAAGPDAHATRRQGSPGKPKRFMVRQNSRLNMTLYNSELWLPGEYGYCDKSTRGSVQYKDQIALYSNTNYGVGFFYVEMSSVVLFTCLTVNMRVAARSVANVWVEHNCPGAQYGLAPQITAGPTLEYESCFYYWKTTAYIELRYRFSSKAEVEVVLYGFTMRYMNVDPWPRKLSTTTEAWQPTVEPARIMYNTFLPWLWNVLY